MRFFLLFGFNIFVLLYIKNMYELSIDIAYFCYNFGNKVNAVFLNNIVFRILGML